MMTTTERDAQCGHAWMSTYDERNKLEGEVRRLKLIEECINHIQRGERPFRHDYMAFHPHNRDEYRSSDVVWAKVKPDATEPDEQYTLVDMPEYEEAMRRVEAASTEPIPETLDPR